MAHALNVDGSRKGNLGVSGGGGCFRDAHGNLLLGFSYYYNRGINIVAEGRALLDGLRLADLHSIPTSIIYTDFKVLIELLKGIGSPPWSLFPWWSQLRDLFSS